MKKVLTSLCLLASAQASANELDNLVQASKDLRSVFATGIAGVGGAAWYASRGGIAPNGMALEAYITQAKQQAYNDALEAMKTADFSDMGAQAYWDQQAADAMNDVNDAVDSYVEAASALITVTELAARAEEAQEANDQSGALAVQNYIVENEVAVELTDVERETYNQSLDNLHDSAQQAAAFYAIAGDSAMIDEANQQAANYTASYSDASDAYFDNSTGLVSVDFLTHNMVVQLSVTDFYKSDVDILTQGQQTDFYVTSPVGGCWFEPPETRQQCLTDAGYGYGP